jgi:hypothetical protein
MGGWRKLQNEELHNLHSSPSIIRMIKSRRIRLAEHVVRTEEKMNAYRYLVEKKGKRPLGRLGRLVLNWILEKQDGVIWTGFICLRTGTTGRLL